MTQMRLFLILLFSITALVITSHRSIAGEELFNAGKSDSSIKPFVFPKSMVVIPSCYPNKGGCVFIFPGVGVLGFDKEIGPKISLIAEILENEKAIKKYLVRLDPARIAPATRGEGLKGYLYSRQALKELGKQHDVDFLFLFRRTIFHPPPRFIRTQGLIYLVRQDKLLTVPFNDQIFKLNVPDFKKKMEEVNQIGLKQLAKDARRVIMSHKFEKRRSNY